MTYAPTRYLTFARRYFGQVSCDLATSGAPLVSRAELGEPADTGDLAGSLQFAARFKF